MDVGPLWALVTTLVASVASLLGCVVGGVIKARECRQLRLENDKLELEIDLLRDDVARRGLAISIPSARELDAALRDRLVYGQCRTPAKASWLTRENDPENLLFDESFAAARGALRKVMIRIAVGAAAACSLIVVALWW